MGRLVDVEQTDDQNNERFYSSLKIHIYNKKHLSDFQKLAQKVTNTGIHIVNATAIKSMDGSEPHTQQPEAYDRDKLRQRRIHWKNMPAFEQKKQTPFLSTTILFDSEGALNLFSDLINQNITQKTTFTHFPERKWEEKVNTNWVSEERLLPKYPIYIISKGRWESRLTSKMLERIDIPYHIVVEPQEYNQYAQYIDEEKILELPFSNLGQGSIPARNWVWQHSVDQGAKRHWILDDNIRSLYRLHQNNRYRVWSPNPFYIIEQFVDRFTNVGMAGMHYKMFAPDNEPRPPFYKNTRIYSFILINNKLDNVLDERWRGRYNEDTDLSLRVLKAQDYKWCTVLFNAFLCDKIATMRMKGGNTEEIYEDTNNRLEFVESLKKQHPNLVEVIKRWGRNHHYVNYSTFKQKLQLKDNLNIPDRINEFGLKLVKNEDK